MKTKKTMSLLSIIIIIIPSFLSTLPPQPANSTQTATQDWTTMWQQWATSAWQYFQPGTAVDPNTGLHYASNTYHIFTDWDLGTYIMAILDAEKIGLITGDGIWGADYRISKIIDFLENRSIRSDGKAYWAYEAATGKETGGVTHPSDAGKLLLALDQIRTDHPEFTTRITQVLNKHNFTGIASDTYFKGNEFYTYYSAKGFQAFGINVPLLKNISNIEKGAFINVYGVSMPKISITPEPLVLAILEGRADRIFENVSYKAFKAQEKRYEDTGNFTAFGEGGYPSGTNYIYEWIVTSQGDTWISRYYQTGNKVDDPAIFTKIAFAYLSLYPNDYSQSLVNYVSDLQTDNGFYEGHFESGGVIEYISDKTNGMILEAARYALSNPVKLNINTEYNSPLKLQSQISLKRNKTGISNITVDCTVHFPNGTILAYLTNETDTNGTATFNNNLTEKTPSGNYTIHVHALNIINSTVTRVTNPNNPNTQTSDTMNTLTKIVLVASITMIGITALLWTKRKKKQNIHKTLSKDMY